MAGAGRAESLDLLKTVLVAGMISAHVVQLIAEEPPAGAWAWSEFVNLVTFSGFLLAFGLGVGLSAGRTRLRTLRERAVPVVKILLAVWASSLGFLLLVEREPLDGWLLREVLSTEVLFGWSEFLTTFLVLYLLLAVARPAFVWVGTRPRWLLAASVLGLASTMVTTGLYWPLIGGVIGHRGYANFPLLAYLPWFLVGIHLGARGGRIEAADLALGAAATGAFLLFLWQEGRLPQRFPPGVLWVIGPGLVLGLYLWACERLGPRVPPVLLAAGRHVLVSLVLSNLLIFGIRYLWGFPVAGGWAILGASLGLWGAVTLWGLLLDRLSRRSAA
jgi:hypothetical protein